MRGVNGGYRIVGQGFVFDEDGADGRLAEPVEDAIRPMHKPTTTFRSVCIRFMSSAWPRGLQATERPGFGACSAGKVTGARNRPADFAAHWMYLYEPPKHTHKDLRRLLQVEAIGHPNPFTVHFQAEIDQFGKAAQNPFFFSGDVQGCGQHAFRRFVYRKGRAGVRQRCCTGLAFPAMAIPAS